MLGRLRTASNPSRTVMAEAPYSFFFAAATGGSSLLSDGVCSGGDLLPPASHETILPSTTVRTDSEAAFLRTYSRRLWNFSIRGASRRLRTALAAFSRL